MNKPVVLDIFCGAGGMSEGFIQAGFDVAFATDLNEAAKLTYTNRHKKLGHNVKFACMDIKLFAKKEFLKDFLGERTIDVVCGGPPCQGFSLAGKRDKSDPRNMLFKSYIEVIKNVKPKYFLMENVEGLLSMELDEFKGISGEIYTNKTIPEILINEFLHIGYSVNYRVLSANDYGVPQTRRRVFFIGHMVEKASDGTYINLVSPVNFPQRNIARDVTIKEAIDDLSFLESGHKSKKYKKKSNSQYQLQSREGRTPDINGKGIRPKELYNHEASKHNDLVIKRFSLLHEGEDLETIKQRLSSDEWDKIKTKKLRCERVIGGMPSPTILTLPDDLVHYSKNRIMTVREFARIQSFDDSFEFLGKRTTGGKLRKTDLPQYTQVGNAVPPLMAKAVAQEIFVALQKTGK